MTSSNSPLQEIICCMGLPATGNPSQFVLERAANAAEIDLRCLTVDVQLDRLGEAISGADAMGFRGLLFADSMASRAFHSCVPDSPQTNSLAAVDTIYRVGDQLTGTHSLLGAMGTWLAETSSEPESVVLLGSGIASRAVACSLAAHGCTNFRFSSAENDDDSFAKFLEQLASESNQVGFEAFKSHADLQEASAAALVVDAAEQPLDRPRGFNPEELADSATYLQASLDPQQETVSTSQSRVMTVVSALDLLTLRYEAVFKTLTGSLPDRALIRESLEEFFLI